ncbi:hypothetical protein ACFY9C_35080 [Streptomyces filamentosus]|uniref:hypothetical protein n=1 Tax=Streptomyces filamentosus TaxID=67294 RepID=UPI0036EA5DFF
MRTFVRSALDSVVESIDIVGMVAGAGAGAVLGFTYSPAGLPDALLLPVTGITALLGALGTSMALDLVLAPVRRRLVHTRYTDRPAPAAVPGTLSEALTEISRATEHDAAVRAAQAAYRIDNSRSELRSEERWRGYETGEASYYLAPGVHLYYRPAKDQQGYPRHSFTLLTGDSPEETPVEGLGEIREHLLQRSKSLALLSV